MEKIKLLYKSQEAVIKLFNGYSSIALEAKNKTISGKGIPSMLACVAKVSNHLSFKTSSSKQMLQRILVALAQVKADNTSENLSKEIKQVIYSFY